MESELLNFGVFAVFLAGIISFLSPCVLPLVPGYISYVSGASINDSGSHNQPTRSQTLYLSLCFVLGFTTVFMLLGAGATVAGEWLQRYRYETNILGGVIIVLFGLMMTGLIRIPWLARDFRLQLPTKGGSGGAGYVLGLAFGFGWTPCIGPILGAILTLNAVSPELSSGVVLLGIFAAGLALPFLLAAWFTQELINRMVKLKRAGRYLNIGAGLILVILGIAIMTGELARFSNWLLEVLPVLGTIG